MIALHRGRWSASIDPDGASLAGLAVDGRALVAGADHPGGRPPYSGAVLIPWVNRIADGRYSFDGSEHELEITEPGRRTALHGLAFDVPWQVESTSDATAKLSYVCGPVPGYPFEVRVDVAYALEVDGLTVTLEAVNDGDQPAPFAAGFHPYFLGTRDHGSSQASPRIDDDLLVSPATQRVLTDPDRLLPVGLEDIRGSAFDFADGRRLGPIELDDAFTDATDGETVIRFGDVTITSSAGFRFHQLFTSSDRRSLAIEPCTAGPDAFNTEMGLRVLRPGAEFRAWWRVGAP